MFLGLLGGGRAFALSALNFFGTLFLARDFVDASDLVSMGVWNVANTSDVLFLIPAIGSLMALLLFPILRIGLLIRGSPESTSA